MTQLSSGSIKIPGLGNGTDFHEMIDQLEQIEMSRALKLNSWKKDWNTRLDAFKQVQSAMNEYSSILKSMNSIDKFMIKNVLNSKEGVCSVTATGSADNTSHTVNVKQKASNSYSNIVLNMGSKLDSINKTGAVQTMEIYLGSDPPNPIPAGDPNLLTVDIPPNCTLEGLKNIINQELGKPTGDKVGVRASIIDVGGQQMLQLYSTRTGEDTKITVLESSTSFWYTDGVPPTVADPGAGNSPWMATQGKNALVRIDGWPAGPDDDDANWLSLKSNTLTHIPGVSITITGTGETVIDISLDTEAISENINTFVDATNQLRIMMKELTDYDASAQIVDSDYAESQFETQKGGVLMGNYGMQLMMSKMKSYIFSKPTGFEYLVKDEATGEILSGDMFASLAHIGIKTDDKEGSPTYGLLVFENNLQVLNGDGSTSYITFEDALNMNAQGIAELFCADCVPAVDGYNFGYFNHLEGFTKPGEYEVSYDVNELGEIVNATINGYPATVGAGNQLTAMGDDNPAKGLVIDIYNMNQTTTGTAPGTPHTGTIRLKSGFLPGLINMVDSDFLDPDSGDKDTKKGTLSVLITQYQNIIAGINDKIAREDERLVVWRRRMESRFANLEATLKIYSGLQAQLEAQVKTLSGNSK